jgi:hypothetical protein
MLGPNFEAWQASNGSLLHLGTWVLDGDGGWRLDLII